MAIPEVFKGVGLVRARDLSEENGVRRSLGDVDQLKFAHRSSSITWKQHQRTGGGNLSKLDSIDGVDLTVQMQEWLPENLALAIQGGITQLAVETVTGEDILLRPGDLAMTEFPGPTEVVLTKTTGGTEIPLTAVVVSAAGVSVPADSSVITADTPATIAYKSTKAVKIEALVQPGKEYELVFDGLNEAKSGSPVIVVVHRWKAPAADELALIDAENPGKLLEKGECLADPSRPANESPFYQVIWL